MNFSSILQRRIDYKWWVTITVTLGMFMSLLDSTIVNVAIPQMQHAFGASIHDVQWVITIYMLTQAAVIPAAPYLTATFGGKRAYVWTLTAFLLGSLLCGFAWNLPSLILFRLIQGIGGGILLPMVMTLQYQAFPPEERGTATSVMGVALMVAPALGPVLGGYLVGSFGWQSAFFINVPLGIVGVIIAQKVLRQTPLQVKQRFDIAGFLTAASGSAIVLYAVSSLTGNAISIWNILLFLGGIMLLLAFIAIERLQTQHGQMPLLDLGRFRDHTFTFSVLALVIVFFITFGILFLMPIYLQTLHQETTLQAGAIQAALALATLVVLPLGGRFADKIGPRSVVMIGLLVFAGAVALMATLTLNTPIWAIVGILILLGCSSALTQQIPVAAMSHIEHKEDKGIANGSTLLTVLRSAAAPLGVAVFASSVQILSLQHMPGLTAQGITGTLLLRQSSMLAMQESFLIASFLALIALVAMWFVPKNRKNRQESLEHSQSSENLISLER